MLAGKFGNMVFVQRQGKTYMRSAPTRTKDSSTPAMLLNQKRFGEVIRFCSLFKYTVIPQIWNLVPSVLCIVFLNLFASLVPKD